MNPYILLLCCITFHSIAMEPAFKKQKKEEKAYNEVLPLDLLKIIFNMVGNQNEETKKRENLINLSRCSCVCKMWNTGANTVYEILFKEENAKLTKYSQEYDNVDEENSADFMTRSFGELRMRKSLLFMQTRYSLGHFLFLKAMKENHFIYLHHFFFKNDTVDQEINSFCDNSFHHNPFMIATENKMDDFIKLFKAYSKKEAYLKKDKDKLIKCLEEE